LHKRVLFQKLNDEDIHFNPSVKLVFSCQSSHQAYFLGKVNFRPKLMLN